MSSFEYQGMTDIDRNDHRQKTFPRSFWSGPIVRARFDRENLGREKQRKGCPVPRADRMTKITDDGGAGASSDCYYPPSLAFVPGGPVIFNHSRACKRGGIPARAS
jgi:hypothetical protein